ncbi:putative integral membrane protein [Babesia bovis T2Bo]|nr:putative integral membrane protein [Babesia bovis T2Bo]EDO08153.2 putative integral membrane protein [Babesia bovis T2Bo]
MTLCKGVLIIILHFFGFLAIFPISHCIIHPLFLCSSSRSHPLRHVLFSGKAPPLPGNDTVASGVVGRSSKRKNLFKQQLEDYVDIDSSNVQSRDGERWQDIVLEEVAKNRNDDPSSSFIFGEHNVGTPRFSEGIGPASSIRDIPFNYRLSPEGRMKIEDRISHLKRLAASEPGCVNNKRPTLWIVRSSFGNYCELLERDEERLSSFVKAVRSHFSPDQLRVMKLQIDIRMPLCEIFFEGDITDLVRIFYARGGTLQFYVVPRFWTRCELLEKDPRLEAKYGKATAPGLFPQWDEEGMLEELIDCMDIRPDYALEFRVPNAWHLLPMVPERDRELMETLFERVHWPTRLRVQKAFESGIEDYRDVISREYKSLQRSDRKRSNILDYWLPPV